MERKPKCLRRINRRESISRRLKTAFTTLIAILLIPSVVILVMMLR